MRVICHIGHHKTGTTSLQAFLSRNFDRLLAAGILYPYAEAEGAALAVSALRGGEGSGPDLLPINFREAHNALAFRMLADTLEPWKVPPYHRHLPHSRQMLLTIRQQGTTLRPDWMVLCSEVMSHFGKVAPDLIRRLHAEAFPQAEGIHLWCTLRRPDEQLVSWHGQQVRFGQSPPPLSDPGRGLNLDWLHVDYRGVIEPWLHRLENVTPLLRPYAESLAAGGSVDDFLAASGLPALGELRPIPALNVSRNPAVISLLRLANGKLPRPLAVQLAEWLDRTAPTLRLPPASAVEFFGPAARARLCAHFRPIHQWLSEIAGRQAFFPDLDGMAHCRPIPEDDARRDLLSQLTSENLAEIEQPELRAFLEEIRSGH